MSFEFDLIQRIRSRVMSEPSVVVGIGDDGCVLSPSEGSELVITTDTLVLGQHFTSDWSANEIGYLAMAVNLSDLAAMGARPKWVMLSLTLPANSLYCTVDWLDDFLDGFIGDHPRATLVGGNLSQGPLTITVQLIGEVKQGQAVTRSGSGEGDHVVVTGTLGDAAAALDSVLPEHPELIRRLRHPSPRIDFGQQLRPLVNAMIDLSDGLFSDLTHLLGLGDSLTVAHSLGATIWLDQLPTSDALSSVSPEFTHRWILQAVGGSDYELLMTVPPSSMDALSTLANACDVPITIIGCINNSGKIILQQPDGNAWLPPHGGWDPFAKGHAHAS